MEELHAVLGGDPTTVPKCSVDTSQGLWVTLGNNKEDIVDKEEEEENAWQASGEYILPDSQELFLTLEPIPAQDQLAAEHDAGEGTSGTPDRPHRGNQEYLGHDDDGYQSYCTVCCPKAMGLRLCVAMQYHVCQHPGDIRRLTADAPLSTPPTLLVPVEYRSRRENAWRSIYRVFTRCDKLTPAGSIAPEFHVFFHAASMLDIAFHFPSTLAPPSSPARDFMYTSCIGIKNVSAH
ncbi:hypothetical protein UY3_17252 [Chelonia mydas]|uniref:Uncharacterized protein n=1 Tax=Chelonia mydas TaxID=8469 RepID=M7B0R3_CHEMY|nr:hypothetical protein UY3_17252 [Chelonia mydas]